MQSIMIVDNDIRSAERLKANMMKACDSCMAVEVFRNGKDALRYLQGNSTKIICLITDICMPGFPGLELIEQMQRINQKLQCIVLSTQKVFEYAIRAMELGVVRYLLKPVDMDKIMQILDILTIKPTDAGQYEREEKLSREVRLVKHEIETGFRNVDMNKVAEELGYSKEYLYRVFRKEMNISVNHYLQNIRLEKAKEYMLEDGKYKIYEICEMVGYEDQVYFSKLFKKKYNISPKEYQKYEKC